MITLVSSLYKPEEHLDGHLTRLRDFARDISGRAPGFEIIIVSNDTSVATCKKLEEFVKTNNAENWLRVCHVSRESLYASWNRGVALAKNDIIGFWNADDARYPDAVADAVRLIKENDAELVYFPFIIKWYLKFFGRPFLIKWKKIIPPVFNRREFARSMHCGPFFIFSRSLYDKVGPFDEQFRIVGDFDWCIRAVKISDKFMLSAKVAGVFKRTGDTLSGGNLRHAAENNIVYIRHGVEDKIQPVIVDLEAEYDPSRVFSSGNSTAI